MADELTSTLSNWLYDMKGPFTENFSKRKRLLTEFERNSGRHNFDGLQVRVPLLLTLAQGTGGLAENGTVNAAQTLDDSKALIPMARVAHAISLSPDLIKSAENGEFAKAGGALKLRMQQAEVAMPRVENEMLNSGGAGIAAGVLVAASASTNTTAITIAAASNWYQIYPGRILDIVTVSTGVPITNGSARTVLSVNKSTGVVTLDAGGGSVNVTSGTHGIGIQGCSGNAIQGIGAATAVSGTFESIDKAAVPQWQGVDGRVGDTSAADLSIAILDGMERESIPSGKEIDFYFGDRAVVDKFGQTLLTQSRWGGAEGELATGWKGIKYRDKIVVPEDDAKPARVVGVSKEAVSLYAYDKGPDWDDFTGMFQRFSRTLPVEAWLVDYVQAGYHQCNSLVFADNLNRAS